MTVVAQHQVEGRFLGSTVLQALEVEGQLQKQQPSSALGPAGLGTLFAEAAVPGSLLPPPSSPALMLCIGSCLFGCCDVPEPFCHPPGLQDRLLSLHGTKDIRYCSSLMVPHVSSCVPPTSALPRWTRETPLPESGLPKCCWRPLLLSPLLAHAALQVSVCPRMTESG